MPIPSTDQANMAKRRNVSAKLEGRTYAAAVEVKNPWVYYDTYVLDAAVTTTVLFNNASGTKVRSLTNYPYQQLPAGQAFDVYGLRVQYWAAAAYTDAVQLDLTTWLNKSLLQFQISNKVPSYERTLAGLIGGQMHVVTAPAVTVNSRNLTAWTGNTLVAFKQKISLDQTIQWQINIVKDAANAAGLTGAYLRVEIMGRLTAQL